MSNSDLDKLIHEIIKVVNNFILNNQPFFVISELKEKLNENNNVIELIQIREAIGVLKNRNIINSVKFCDRSLYYSQDMVESFKKKIKQNSTE